MTKSHEIYLMMLPFLESFTQLQEALVNLEDLCDMQLEEGGDPVY